VITANVIQTVVIIVIAIVIIISIAKGCKEFKAEVKESTKGDRHDNKDE
jgi:hypothetical protein